MFVNVFVDLKIFINIQTRGWWGINQKWTEVGLLLFRQDVWWVSWWSIHRITLQHSSK